MSRHYTQRVITHLRLQQLRSHEHGRIPSSTTIQLRRRLQQRRPYDTNSTTSIYARSRHQLKHRSQNIIRMSRNKNEQATPRSGVTTMGGTTRLVRWAHHGGRRIGGRGTHHPSDSHPTLRNRQHRHQTATTRSGHHGRSGRSTRRSGSNGGAHRHYGGRGGTTRRGHGGRRERGTRRHGMFCDQSSQATRRTLKRSGESGRAKKNSTHRRD